MRLGHGENQVKREGTVRQRARRRVPEDGAKKKAAFPFGERGKPHRKDEGVIGVYP
jgi:hypothetical protein